jgi:hypothetical protein
MAASEDRTGKNVLFVLKDAATGETERVVDCAAPPVATAEEPAPRPRSKRVEVRHAKAPRANVVLILQDADTGEVVKVVEAHNIVTTDGSTYYAQRGSTMVPTSTFWKGKLALASSYNATEAVTRTINNLIFTSGTTGIQSFDSGYPKVADGDTDNTGAGTGILTYRRTYSTSQGNFTIKALGIVKHDWITNPAGSAALRKILNYVTLATAQRITKTSSQTLKVFVNHTFTGV